MNVEFLNPFVEAATETLQVEVQLKAVRGGLSLQKSALTANEITVLIHLIGQVQGLVLYGMEKKTACGIVSKILGEPFDEFDNLAQSGTAELANVISGKATVNLSKAGYQSNISPPTLITGKGVQISTLDFARLVVPLQTELGEIVVHLALRESPPGMQSTNFIPLATENLDSEVM